MRSIPAAGVLALIFCVACLPGCGKNDPPGPATAPLQGKLVFTKGGTVKALADRQGRIEFESVDQPGMRSAALIQEDGSFTVATVVEKGGSQGAVPGKHRGRLLLDERDEKLVAPQFLSYDKSGIVVQVPAAQPVEIKVWR